MKNWIKFAIPIVAIGIVGVAQAKEGKHAITGLKGKIVGLSGNGSVIIQTGKNPNGGVTQMTLHTDANTTIEIDGAPGKRVVDLRAGEKVVVQGDPTGIVTDIQAKQSKHHHGGLRRIR